MQSITICWNIKTENKNDRPENVKTLNVRHIETKDYTIYNWNYMVNK